MNGAECLSSAELKTRFLKRLGEKLSAFGFKPRIREQRFVKPIPLGSWVFHAAFAPIPTGFEVSVDVGSRVGFIEEAVHRHSRISDKLKKQTVTVGAELGNIADRRPRYWAVRSEDDLDEVVRSIVQQFQQWGLPYLERLSDPDLLIEELGRTDEGAWIVNPLPELRFQRAVALAMTRGLSDRARDLARTGEQVLTQRRDPAVNRFREFARALLGISD